jgi:hypothetical protein
MKVTTISSIVLAGAIISGICLISYSLYDYYINNAFEGLILYLFISIAWLTSLIFSIIYAVRKIYRRIGLYSLLANVISLIIVVSFFVIIPLTSLKRYALPRHLSDKDFNNQNFKQYSNDSSYFIVLIHRESDMAFGSGHNFLGLYTKSNKIVDECTFGEFPIYFDSWHNDTIKLKTKLFNKDMYTIQYVNSWVNQNKKIKNFNIHFQIE